MCLKKLKKILRLLILVSLLSSMTSGAFAGDSYGGDLEDFTPLATVAMNLTNCSVAKSPNWEEHVWSPEPQSKQQLPSANSSSKPTAAPRQLFRVPRPWTPPAGSTVAQAAQEYSRLQDKFARLRKQYQELWKQVCSLECVQRQPHCLLPNEVKIGFHPIVDRVSAGQPKIGSPEKIARTEKLIQLARARLGFLQNGITPDTLKAASAYLI